MAKATSRDRSAVVPSVLVVLASLVPLVIAAACSDASGPSPGTAEDGGSVLPSADGSPEAEGGAVEDAGVDAFAPDAAPRICSDDDFCHSVVPAGEHFRGLWGDGDGILWAASLEQNILRWDGAAWKVHHHCADPITAIWGSGPTDVWVSTSKGLLHGVGATSAEIAFSASTYVPGNSSAPILSIWGMGPDDVWAVGGFDDPLRGTRGRVVHYTDDPDLGRGWRLVDELSSQNIRFRGVWGSPKTGTWVDGVQLDPDSGIYRARVFRRAPAATEWTSITLPEDPEDIHRPFAGDIGFASIVAETSIWLFGRTGLPRDVLWRGASSDDGASFTWTIRNPNPGRPMYAIWGIGADDLWAVGRTGLVSHWNGSTWQQAVIRVGSPLVDRSLWAIWGKSNDDFWVVGDEIALHRTRAGKP